MAFLSKCLYALIILLAVETTVAQKDFNWKRSLRLLRKNKKLWQRKSVNDYVFLFNPMCFCLPCYVEQKYVTVDSDRVTDAAYADANNGCNIDDYKPFRKNFDTIDGLFNKAIAHAKKGSEANCTTTANQPFPSDAICGGSIDATYDPILNYPLTISLNYGPFIADAGMSYTVSCLDVVSIGSNTDLSQYNNACNVVNPPIDGDPNDEVLSDNSFWGMDMIKKRKGYVGYILISVAIMVVLMILGIVYYCVSGCKGMRKRINTNHEYEPLLTESTSRV